MIGGDSMAPGGARDSGGPGISRASGTARASSVASGSRISRSSSGSSQPWPVVRLGDVCEVFTDGNWIESKDQSESGIRLIQTGNIGNGVFLNKEARARYVSIDTFSRLKCFEIFPGDVLISRLPEPVGRACKLVDIKERMITAVDCTVARFKPTIISDFFVCYSQSVRYNTQVADMLTGTTRARISRSNLAKVLIPLPPLAVQREIVAWLEKELGESEKVVAKFKRLAELADETFKAELDETFNTIEGEKVRLGDVGKIVTGSTPSKSCTEYFGGPYCFFKPTDLNQGCNTTTSSDSLTASGWAVARKVPADSVLVTCIGATLGKVGIIRHEGSCNQQINAIIPDRAISEFVYYCVRSPAFQFKLWHKSDATTLPLVSKKEFSDLSIPLPPLAIQRAIVAKLDAAKERCEKLKSAALRGLAAAENLRKAILAEAFQ